MKPGVVFKTRNAWVIALFALFFGGAAVSSTASGLSREQAISLEAGWNAVYLEVSPPNSEPDVVFQGTPIDVVAAYYPRSSAAQFMKDPAANLFEAAGWGVWYSEARSDSFLTDLHSISGPQPYLVHATDDFEWRVTGTVTWRETQWRADAFNLVGFSVSATAPPTFGQFFSGSEAHQHNRIYRLVEGSWRRVEEPYRTAMSPGEAFWVYCDGGSSYQGPFRVGTTVRQGIALTGSSDLITLRNETDHPLGLRMTHVANGRHPVPLSILVRAIRDDAFAVESIAARKPAGFWEQELPVLRAGGSIGIPLEARTREMTRPAQESLIKISSDVGTEAWVPVIASRDDLEETEDGS